ncbi:tetratricopeptide repeat protein [Bdellovibrio sp. HCB2-146]|uniref:tetratricopeptide repeat protein n=1 Tax=Bdellovibrio sp. HCB2-146 TaxID=3394362 RepID=UPI0039BCC710
MKKTISLLVTLPLIYNVATADSGLNVKKTARPAAQNMRVKTSQVPTYELYNKKVVNGKVEVSKVKNIPRLDIGEERQVNATAVSPLRLPASRDVQVRQVQRRPSPELITASIAARYNVTPVANAKVVTNSEAFNKIPDVKVLSPIADPATTEPHVSLVKIDEMKPNDYKLLQALIFLDMQKNYELAMALFAELMDDKEHRLEALYQYAMTAKALGLSSEYREYMMKVVQETKNKDWQQKATEALISSVADIKNSDVALIDPLVTKYDLDVTKNEEYQLTRAKYYSEKGNLGMVEDALIYIPETSPRYPDALILSALFNYRQGKVDEAVYTLENLMKLTESNKTSQIRAIGALTLARIQFQKSQYKEAFQSYLKVDKSNPLWLQAMVESAWTQILSEDYEGAAGNMFSLHTDFFKNAFAPESYVVRTVGYLNLCQYGDGAQILQEMNKRYSPWKKKLEEYAATHKSTTAYYDTVKGWLKNSDLKEVDGLPRSFIVELARHPAYMNLQKQINSYEDEITRFNKIALTLIKMERELTAKQASANKDFADAKKGGSNIEKAERKLMSYRIQYHIAKKARASIKNLRTAGLARIEKEKTGMRETASKALQGRFGDMLAALDRVLDQNEVLKYELYSGAGEHIRYQMAGGEVNEKERPELKVEQEKSLNWKFKGEIWEDEVGHYRSSLKNVCAQESNVAGMADQ